MSGYRAIHIWMNKHHPRTGTCEDCGAADRITDLASIGHTYTRDRKDWRELCRRCHRIMDGMVRNGPAPARKWTTEQRERRRLWQREYRKRVVT